MNALRWYCFSSFASLTQKKREGRVEGFLAGQAMKIDHLVHYGHSHKIFFQHGAVLKGVTIIPCFEKCREPKL